MLPKWCWIPSTYAAISVENAARSIALTPRVERVSIAANSPISGGVENESDTQQLKPEKQRLEMLSEEELDVLLERNDEADDDLMEE